MLLSSRSWAFVLNIVYQYQLYISFVNSVPHLFNTKNRKTCVKCSIILFLFIFLISFCLSLILFCGPLCLLTIKYLRVSKIIVGNGLFLIISEKMNATQENVLKISCFPFYKGQSVLSYFECTHRTLIGDPHLT